MGKIRSLSEKREEKIIESAKDFLSDMMDGDEVELDRRLKSIRQNWQQYNKQTERGEIVVVEKLYTPAEVAQHLGLAEKTIRDFLRAKTIHGVKVGKEWRVRERDLQAYIDALTDGATMP